MRNNHLFFNLSKDNTPNDSSDDKAFYDKYKKIYNDLDNLYQTKCKQEYYIHYDECEHIRFFINKMKDKYKK